MLYYSFHLNPTLRRNFESRVSNYILIPIKDKIFSLVRGGDPQAIIKALYKNAIF